MLNITIKVPAYYIHIPDGVFLEMMQGTREQQEMQPVNHHVFSSTHNCLWISILELQTD